MGVSQGQLAMTQGMPLIVIPGEPKFLLIWTQPRSCSKATLSDLGLLNGDFILYIPLDAYLKCVSVSLLLYPCNLFTNAVSLADSQNTSFGCEWLSVSGILLFTASEEYTAE